MADSKTLSALVEMNVRWLRQATDLLAKMEEPSFSESPSGMEPHRACSHLRHVIEFYECFLEGSPLGRVDYDGRRRDLLLESSRAVATARVCAIIERLTGDPGLLQDRPLAVRMEDAGALGLEDPFLDSSVGRELQVLSSHTIHHFALLAMALRAHGMQMDADFGVAPSTLRYREQVADGAAAKAEAA